MQTPPVDEFIRAACVPRTGPHADGTLDRARSLLAAHPGIAAASIHTAAILGESTLVRAFLAADPAAATARGGPYAWDALTHLCFSNFLKLDAARSAGFVESATLLLDAGADPNGGFHEPGHSPTPEFESVLYGACGVAHHTELTRLLLARGADGNDEEVTYHAPETYDNAALEVLVRHGRLTADGLTTLLLRKSDWHDVAGIRWLLAQGADPARPTRWAPSTFVHAISRDNSLEILALMLDHGADPLASSRGASAMALAARAGRGDLLDELARRGVPIALSGADALLAACARDDGPAVARLRATDPDAVRAVLADAPSTMARFAGIGNAAGIGHLLDLGVPVDLPLAPIRIYWNVPPGSTALHVAAWRARHEAVAVLLSRGASVAARDGTGATALMHAVRAGTDSYWASRRATDSVERLLAAGSPLDGVPFPTGWEEVDALLRARGAR